MPISKFIYCNAMQCNSFRLFKEVMWLSWHFAAIPLVPNNILIKYFRGEVENLSDSVPKYCVKASSSNSC